MSILRNVPFCLVAKAPCCVPNLKKSCVTLSILGSTSKGVPEGESLKKQVKNTHFSFSFLIILFIFCFLLFPRYFFFYPILVGSLSSKTMVDKSPVWGVLSYRLTTSGEFYFQIYLGYCFKLVRRFFGTTHFGLAPLDCS